MKVVLHANLVPLDFDEKLSDIIAGENQYIVNEFALGIVGIGALFFAYAQVPPAREHLRILIVLIGLSASFVMWMHMFGSSQEVKSAMIALKCADPSYYANLKAVRSWRETGKTRWMYYPVTRLMTYFMALVSMAWASIGLALYGISFSTLVYADALGLLIVAGRLIHKRWKELTGRGVY